MKSAKSECFDHELPNEKIVENANAKDLFQTIIQEFERVRRETRMLIDELIDCSISDIEEYRKLALRRGRILIVRDDLDPVDVIFRPKQEPGERKPG